MDNDEHRRMLLSEAESCLTGAIGKMEQAIETLDAAYRILRAVPVLAATLSDACAGLRHGYKKAIDGRSYLRDNTR